ncbi:hypothetical protein Avbf_05145 [Armadillidium vulgare]|nr:hypothetical protein Avbf_05145 [Armadillidium vulgare]
MDGQSREDTPEGSVQDFETIYNFMHEWKPEKDVIGIKYAPLAISSTIASSSGYINHFFRKAVKLGGKGFTSSFLPNVVIPSLLGTAAHIFLVTKPILITERGCPVCMEVRSGLVSLCAGLIYPCLLIPFNVFLNANRYLTYYIPPITREPLECLNTARTILFKPHLPRILILASFQFFVGMSVAHLQMSDVTTVFEKSSFYGCCK